LIQFAENCNNDLKRKNIKLLNIAGINAKFKNIRAFIRDLKATNPIYKDLNLDLWEKLSIPENHLSSQEKEIQSQTQISPLESDILERYLIEKYPNTAQGIKNFKVHTNSSPHVFWSKILAIYTGARSEELAQLQVSDFKRVELNGKVIFYFNIIVTDYEKQSLKTSSSRRIVPLHNNLIKLDFKLFTREKEIKKRVFI
jgi:integrase